MGVEVVLCSRFGTDRAIVPQHAGEASTLRRPFQAFDRVVQKRARTASSARLLAKVAKLDEEFASLDERVKANQQDRDIAAIVLEFQDNPQKIPACLRAVRGNSFLPKEEIETRFPEGALYLYKVPRCFVHDIVLEAGGGLMDPDRMKLLVKAAKLAIHKLVYRAALLDQSTPVTTIMREEYRELIMGKLKAVGCKWSTLRVDPQSGAINWKVSGAFTLVPIMPADHVGDWSCTGIVFNDSIIVPLLPAGSVNRTALINEPWSLKRATLILNKGSSMETKKRCADTFKGQVAVKNFLDALSLKDGDGDGGDEIGSKPAPSAKPVQPVTAKTTLSRNQVGAMAKLGKRASGRISSTLVDVESSLSG